MQRLIDSINHGYTNWCSGSIPMDRCHKLVKKFDLTYQILADRNERARRKRAGLGNATLILWLNHGAVQWWLLVSPPEAGDHAAHSIETLKNATHLNGRIEIDGFELVRLPKKTYQKAGSNSANNVPPAPKKKHTTLTWRMKEDKYQAWRESIIDSVRGASTRSLEALLYKLWSSPGFYGIRTQVGKLAALYRAEVKRASRKDAPPLPKRLGYVRRLANQGITLGELLAQTKSHPSGGSAAAQIAVVTTGHP
jgi:hypothetical protein